MSLRTTPPPPVMKPLPPPRLLGRNMPLEPASAELLLTLRSLMPAPPEDTLEEMMPAPMLAFLPCPPGTAMPPFPENDAAALPGAEPIIPIVPRVCSRTTRPSSSVRADKSSLRQRPGRQA